MNQIRPSGISLCMIVKNEERFLEGALHSVAGVVDEICIVDTGSTDRTLEIAHAFGARVASVPWQDDFSQARNAALALATRRWIFVLDADERLDVDSHEAMRAIGAEPVGLRGKWIACRNLSDDVAGSGAMTNALVRIFPNDARIRYRNAIHEFVALDGTDGGVPSDRTPIEIIHYGYLATIIAEREKGERNLRLSRVAVEREPDDPFHHYNLAMSLLLAQDRDAAIAEFEVVRRLTAATPRGYRAQALVVLADLLSEHRGDHVRAGMVLAEAIAVAPNFSNAHFTHGKLLVRAGRPYEARDAFGRAIAAGTHDVEQFVVDNEIAIWKAHSEIGATLMNEERYAEALRWFELAAQARPSAAPLILNRAKCCEALGDTAAAEVLFRAAHDGFADEPSAIEWVNFLFRHGRESAALAAIEESLARVGPGYARVFLGSAAVAHMRAGRDADARLALERAQAIGDPAETAAVLRALAAQLGEPALENLLATAPATRASGLRIAYVPPQ